MIGRPESTLICLSQAETYYSTRNIRFSEGFLDNTDHSQHRKYVQLGVSNHLPPISPSRQCLMLSLPGPS